MQQIAVFCGSSIGFKEVYAKGAKKLGEYFAKNNIGLVYGGGNSGLMGIIADEFLKLNREVIGVRPDILLAEEISHQKITEMISTKDMFDRKKKMVELSDIFIALPGGVGTLDEIIEVFTLNKINSIDKKCGIYNINNFYKGLDDLLSTMVKFNYLDEDAKNELIVEDKGHNLILELEK